MYLNANIYSAVVKDKLRGKKGEKVTIVSTHGHVAIVQKQDGTLFSVEVIFLSETENANN